MKSDDAREGAVDVASTCSAGLGKESTVDGRSVLGRGHTQEDEESRWDLKWTQIKERERERSAQQKERKEGVCACVGDGWAERHDEQVCSQNV